MLSACCESQVKSYNIPLVIFLHSLMNSLTTLTPRLWPFLRHNIVSVRRAALETLLTLLTLHTGSSNNGEVKKEENGGGVNETVKQENLKQESGAEGEMTGGPAWLVPICQDLVRHIYQRSVLEERNELLPLVVQVWRALLEAAMLEQLVAISVPWLGVWMAFLMQPPRTAYDPSLLIEAKHKPRDNTSLKARHQGAEAKLQMQDHKNFIGGCDGTSGNPADREAAVYRSRVCGARLLGILARRLCEAPVNPSVNQLPNTEEPEPPAVALGKLFTFHLAGRSAIQRFVCGQVIYYWATESKSTQSMLNHAPRTNTFPPTHGQNSSQATLPLKVIEPTTHPPESKSEANSHSSLPSSHPPAEPTTHPPSNPHSHPCPCPPEVKSQLLASLGELIYFDEIAFSFTHMQTDCQGFLASLKQHNLDLDSAYPPGQLLTLESALGLVTSTYQSVRPSLRPQVVNKFDERQKQLLNTVQQTSYDQQMYSVRVLCSLAMAVVALDALPEKLNPVVRPLMDVIKKEENPSLQEEAAQCLAQLIKACISRDPSPNVKIVKNLCNFLCVDPSMTPNVDNPLPVPDHKPDHSGQEVTCSKSRGILTLSNLQRVSEQSIRRRMRRSQSLLKSDASGGAGPVVVDAVKEAEQLEQQKLTATQRLGAETALTTLARSFASDLPHLLPALWGVCLDTLSQSEKSITNLEVSDSSKLQDFVNNLQVMETVIPAIHTVLLPHLTSQLEQLCQALKHPSTAVRHLSSRVLAALSIRSTREVMHHVIRQILPLLGATDCDDSREGATEAVANILECLGLDCLPYVVLLVIPVLGCMSDHTQAVRLMATHCFATLVRLMPLESGIPNPPDTADWLSERKEKERKFLEQLFDMNKLDVYPIGIPVKAELRQYQQAGVNWLGFLNKYKLHGILCDDMGLGKTLQSICVLATDHKQRELESQHERGNTPGPPLPSIVVCPPTLVGHWVYEVNKFVDRTYLNPLMYVGPPAERMRLQKRFPRHNLIVASYDVVRNDIDFFGKVRWNYCILDEGHIIRNGKTKLAKATKQLVCQHRLILSGTPIQNNVLDLWSLFDFLMPGFLGTEKQFQAKYGKPILQSRDAKSTSKEQEAGALAMEALHRQVLPFILRRLKEDVLKDLPPKIMQDYYCDLSPLQVELYEDFAKSRAKRAVDDTVSGGEGEVREKKGDKHGGTTHIFQALQYLRKVCNHPALVLTPSHPKYQDMISGLQKQNSNLHDLTHAPKLNALKQLLNDCGIGVAESGSGSAGSGQSGLSSVDSVPVVNQHRVLLFCQLKSMLDIVEKDLLRARMPSVTFLRLGENQERIIVLFKDCNSSLF